MHTTTLPISYRPGRSFRIVSTSLISSIFARITGSKYVLALNAISLRDKRQFSTEELLLSFQDDMNNLGCDKPDFVFADRDPVFFSFVEDHIAKICDDSFCTTRKMDILFCPCGKVESPKSVLELAVSEDRSDFVEVKERRLYCVFCNHPLKQSTQEVLVHRPVKCDNIRVLPYGIKGRVNALSDDFASHPIIFSRNIRPNSLTFENKAIDPDFCWMHILGYIHSTTGETEFCLIVGNDCIPQAVKVILYTKVHYPQLNITLVTHPIFQFPDKPGLIQKKMTVSDFVGACGNAANARTLIASSIQWSRHYSSISVEDINLIINSYSNRPVIENKTTNLSPADTLNVLKRDFVLKFLKALRQRRKLNSEETLLLNALKT